MPETPEVRRPPPSIHAASLSLLLAISVMAGAAFLVASRSQASLSQYLVLAGLFGLLLLGIVRGHRLAWMWGRYLTFVLALLVLVIAGGAALKGGAAGAYVAMLILGLAAPLFAVSFALGRRSALEWFDLVCPECGMAAARGKDFLFRQARCGKCRHVW
jgi:hypothetical protein